MKPGGGGLYPIFQTGGKRVSTGLSPSVRLVSWIRVDGNRGRWQLHGRRASGAC